MTESWLKEWWIRRNSLSSSAIINIIVKVGNTETERLVLKKSMDFVEIKKIKKYFLFNWNNCECKLTINIHSLATMHKIIRNFALNLFFFIKRKRHEWNFLLYILYVEQINFFLSKIIKDNFLKKNRLKWTFFLITNPLDEQKKKCKREERKKIANSNVHLQMYFSEFEIDYHNLSSHFDDEKTF